MHLGKTNENVHHIHFGLGFMVYDQLGGYTMKLKEFFNNFLPWKWAIILLIGYGAIGIFSACCVICYVKKDINYEAKERMAMFNVSDMLTQERHKKYYDFGVRTTIQFINQHPQGAKEEELKSYLQKIYQENMGEIK
jgi:hypothetical protein